MDFLECELPALDHPQGTAEPAEASIRNLKAAFRKTVKSVEGNPYMPRQGLPTSFNRVEPKTAKCGPYLSIRHSFIFGNCLPGLVAKAAAGVTLTAAFEAAANDRTAD